MVASENNFAFLIFLNLNKFSQDKCPQIVHLFYMKCTHTCTHQHAHAHTNTHTCTHQHTHMYTCTCTRMHAHACMRVCTHACTHACIHARAGTHVIQSSKYMSSLFYRLKFANKHIIKKKLNQQKIVNFPPE